MPIGRELTEPIDDDPAPPAVAGGTPPPGEPPSDRPPPLARFRRPEPRPEELLGHVLGSYRLLEVLGKGGMGFVFRAEHEKLGRAVALKLLRGDYAGRRDAVSRFFHEARTVNRVRHRNIVDVTDLVELDDGTTYIIMELLAGESFGSWLRSAPPLPRVLGALIQICDGLAAAHQVGVVHRDLKPDNVMIVPAPDDSAGELVKLLDFGVAKLVHRDDADVGFQTQAGSVIGTPAYMSPEQAGGMAVDGRSDIYSLGAIMYELFCGQPVFRGRSFGEFVRKHLTETPTAPLATPGGAAMDPRLAAVIWRCLDKDPDQRYAHIGELREALLEIAAGPAQPSVVAPPASDADAIELPTRPRSRPRSTWWKWPVGALIVAASAAVVAALWIANSDEPVPQPSVAAPPAAAPAAPPPAAAPAPAAEPMPAAAPTPVPAATPRPPEHSLIEVHASSQPRGALILSDHRAELCHTPCSFFVDPADGGPARRTYTVVEPGYADAPLDIDLGAAKHALHVVLHRSTRHAGKSGKRADRPAQPPTARASEPRDPAPDEPVEPAAKKPVPPIDPADTLDPFRGKPQR